MSKKCDCGYGNSGVYIHAPDCPAMAPPTPTTTDRLAEVTQEDRDATRPFMDRFLDGSSFADDRGELEQAFARHRIAATQSQQAELKTVLDREADTQRRHDVKLDKLEAEIERLREALARIAKGEVEEFDSDLQRTVTLSMCESEMEEIARAALNPGKERA